MSDDPHDAIALYIAGFSFRSKLRVFTPPVTHFTPSNDPDMYVKHHKRVKSLEKGAFYPFRKKVKENPAT